LRTEGFSLVETIIVTAVLLVSLLLVFKMLQHVTIWWRLEEDRCDRTAMARHALGKITNLLFMAGYRPSERGIHAMGEKSLSVEYLAEGAEEAEGEYSRHRLHTIFLDGSQLKLTTRRRRLPLTASPSWGAGSTVVLAEGVRDFSFRYLDVLGRETEHTGDVRVVVFSLHLGDTGKSPDINDQCYSSAVVLRNNNG
jgi:hypothetical protein